MWLARNSRSDDHRLQALRKLKSFTDSWTGADQLAAIRETEAGFLQTTQSPASARHLLLEQRGTLDLITWMSPRYPEATRIAAIELVEELYIDRAANRYSGAMNEREIETVLERLSPRLQRLAAADDSQQVMETAERVLAAIKSIRRTR